MKKDGKKWDKRWDNLKPLAPIGEEALSTQNLAVKLPKNIDALVRSLPNRSAWMRRVLVEAAERELVGGDDASK
jgi:hypothetical protein